MISFITPLAEPLRDTTGKPGSHFFDEAICQLIFEYFSEGPILI